MNKLFANRHWLPRLEIVLLSLVLALAALYRLDLALLNVAPPGCFSDEAHYGLDALAVLDGHHAVFFPNNGGREPLFIYLVAGSIALFGRTVVALRLPAALAGIATVGLTFLAVREMFRRSLGQGGALAVATLASLFLAFSRWHITFSRIAFRASTTPLLEVLAFWLLWRGLNAARDRATTRVAPTVWFTLSGVALGACLYTYLASRFVPLVLGFFVFGWFMLRWANKPALSVYGDAIPWRGFVLLALVAVVVFAPLGAYFATHPDDFLHRAGEASVFNPAWNRGDPLGTFADSAIKAVGMLFWAGDPNWRHNIAGQPILDPITALLFLVGLALALWRIRQLPYLFAVVWLVVMMLPSALTAEGIPNSLRNLAASPVVYVFPALASVHLWLEGSRITHHVSRFTFFVSRITLVALITIILLLTATLTFHDYFVTWANHPMTAKAMNADMRVVEVAEYMNAHADGDTAFLLLNTYEHPAVDFLYDGESPYASLPEGGDVPATVRRLCRGQTRLAGIRWDWLDSQAMTAENFALDMLDAYATRVGEEAGPGFRTLTYELPLAVLFPIRLRHRDAQFGEAAQLTGYLFRTPGTGPDTAVPSDDAWVVLRWHLSGDGDEPPTLKVTLRLLDADGQLVVQLDKALTGPESDHREARAGDDVTDYYRLSIPPDTSPGTYTLVVGVYPPDTMQLLPVTVGAETDILLTLGPITITAP
jgi:4-amino-4-deoxy-L-arabinose transferase-like glycosyltransferase